MKIWCNIHVIIYPCCNSSVVVMVGLGSSQGCQIDKIFAHLTKKIILHLILGSGILPTLATDTAVLSTVLNVFRYDPIWLKRYVVLCTGLRSVGKSGEEKQAFPILILRGM